MPRKTRRRLLGKWPGWDQERRDKELRQLLRELRSAWRQRFNKDDQSDAPTDDCD
jgi:hypothetical protein